MGLKIVILILLSLSFVHSAGKWEQFDVALGFKLSKVLNYIVMRFLTQSNEPDLSSDVYPVYNIAIPDTNYYNTHSSEDYSHIEKSYIELINKIMENPILDHGAEFKNTLNNLSTSLLRQTCSKYSLECDNYLDENYINRPHLSQYKQKQLVNLLVFELCKISELANSYWSDELDQFINLFLSKLGYTGGDISKLNKNCAYKPSELENRQRFDLYKYFQNDIKESYRFISELGGKIGSLFTNIDSDKNDINDIDIDFLKYFPHEYYSYLEWMILYGYLEKFKTDLIKEINLNTNYNKTIITKAVRFISGYVIKGNFVKLINNHIIEDKIYKILHIKGGKSNYQDNGHLTQMLLLDMESGKEFPAASNTLIKTLNLACKRKSIKSLFLKELAIGNKYFYLKNMYINNDEECKIVDIILNSFQNLIYHQTKLIENFNHEHVVRAIEILNYSLKFNELPNDSNEQDLMRIDDVKLRAISIPNLMRLGSPFLYNAISKLYILTGRLPEFQNCSISNATIAEESVFMPFKDKIFKNWKKPLKILFSNLVLDLSFDDKSKSFWDRAIKINRFDDINIVNGMVGCTNKCVKSSVFGNELENEIVFDILRRISWQNRTELIYLDKLVAKLYNIVAIRGEGRNDNESISVSEKISNVYIDSTNKDVSYKLDSIFLSYLRWIENNSNQVQKIPLINFYNLATNVSSLLINTLTTYNQFVSKKRMTSIYKKILKFLSIYVYCPNMSPHNYPLASHIIRIALFLNYTLENIQNRFIKSFSNNIMDFKNTFDLTYSNHYKFEESLSLLRRNAVEFIFQFMSNVQNQRISVLEYFKNKFLELFVSQNRIRSIINNGENANMEYGRLAVATVLLWALNGQDIIPKERSEEWKSFVSNIYSSYDIPQYRKFFLYMIMNNGKSPDQVALEGIKYKCSNLNFKKVKKYLTNVLSTSCNILLVLEMANQIIQDCNKPNYNILKSKLYTEFKCNELKRAAIKNYSFQLIKRHKIIINRNNMKIIKNMVNSNIECNWFYDSKYYKLVTKLNICDDGINKYRDDRGIVIRNTVIDYEHVPTEVFISGVYDYYSSLFIDENKCNEIITSNVPKSQYGDLLNKSKKLVILQDVFDDEIYIFKAPIQSNYKFGKIFISEDTFNAILKGDIEIPECNGKCNADDIRRIAHDDKMFRNSKIKTFKRNYQQNFGGGSSNDVIIPKNLFETYKIRDFISKEDLTIKDITNGNVFLCVDENIFHNIVDLSVYTHLLGDTVLSNNAIMDFKFFKITNESRDRIKCQYVKVKLEEHYDDKKITNPVDLKFKTLGRSAINVKY